jgi:hypothetical protein
MNFKTGSLLVVTCVIASLSCKNEEVAKSSMQNLIPKPVSANATNDFFELTKETTIYVQSNSEADIHVGNWFADQLKPATGYSLNVALSKRGAKSRRYLSYLCCKRFFTWQ